MLSVFFRENRRKTLSNWEKFIFLRKLEHITFVFPKNILSNKNKPFVKTVLTKIIRFPNFSLQKFFKKL